MGYRAVKLYRSFDDDKCEHPFTRDQVCDEWRKNDEDKGQFHTDAAYAEIFSNMLEIGEYVFVGKYEVMCDDDGRHILIPLNGNIRNSFLATGQ
jgi:hypothetical protein